MGKMGKLLLICDFDGTIAETFRPSPNQIDVHGAYEYAIGQIFGRAGLVAYTSIGGLQNRAPIELVGDLIKFDKDLIKSAELFVKKAANLFLEVVPPGKGWETRWDVKNPSQTITEFVVRVKLRLLLKEINKKWPRPCQGFIDFYKKIQGMDIDLAILTSGHDTFIQQVFQGWNLTHPEIMITDDDIRGRYENLFKPNPRLMALIRAMWCGERDNTLYIGDDPVKDGQLANNAGITFGWFNPQSKKNDSLTNYFSFGDWSEVLEILKERRFI